MTVYNLQTDLLMGPVVACLLLCFARVPQHKAFGLLNSVEPCVDVYYYL